MTYDFRRLCGIVDTFRKRPKGDIGEIIISVLCMMNENDSEFLNKFEHRCLNFQFLNFYSQEIPVMLQIKGYKNWSTVDISHLHIHGMISLLLKLSSSW